MVPTLEDGAVFLTNKTQWKKRRIKKGDIIFGISPVDRNSMICKRVKGTGGETVFVERLNKSTMVPPNQYWLEGDNKQNSYDSRHHGPVDAHLIKGVAICQIYPKFQWL